MKQDYWTTKDIMQLTGKSKQRINEIASKYSMGFIDWKYRYYTEEEKEVIVDILSCKKSSRMDTMLCYIKNYGPVTENQIVEYFISNGYCTDSNTVKMYLADLSEECGYIRENEKNGIYYEE